MSSQVTHSQSSSTHPLALICKIVFQKITPCMHVDLLALLYDKVLENFLALLYDKGLEH